MRGAARSARRRTGWCRACVGDLGTGRALLGRAVEDDVPAAHMAAGKVIALAHSNLALNAVLAGSRAVALA